MDGDGELQPEDDLNGTRPCMAGSSQSGDDREHQGNNPNGTPDDDDDDDDDDEDDEDTTDGGPPQLEAAEPETDPPIVKRRHVQSKRMQEYQEQRSSQIPRQPRVCPHCGHTLYSGPGYRYHVQKHKHHTSESFICDSCQKVFKSRNGLKYHQKRKRCRGSQPASSVSPSSHAATLSSVTATRMPPPLNLGRECKAERLMELATIATGPQSPLLQSPGQDSRGSESFFNDTEASAVIALSNMKTKRSSEPRSSIEGTSSSTTLQHQHADRQQHTDKAKRPMNGFMLYAQKHRADLNKQYPDMNNRMISTKLSEEWNKLSEEERQRWKDEARQKAEQVQRAHPDCWKRKK